MIRRAAVLGWPLLVAMAVVEGITSSAGVLMPAALSLLGRPAWYLPGAGRSRRALPAGPATAITASVAN